MIYVIGLLILAILALLDFVGVKEKEVKTQMEVESTTGRRSRSNIKVKENKVKPYKLIIFIVIVIILIVFAGLRYYIGLDYSMYSTMYYQIMDGQKIALEPGYVYANKIFVQYFRTPTMLFLLFSLLTVGFKAIVIKKSTNKIFFALFIAVSLYFFIGTMGQIRSALAQSIDLVALYFFIKDKKIIAFVLMIIAIAFHVSAIIFLAIFILGARKNNTIFTIVLLVAAAIGGYYFNLKGIGIFSKEMFGFIGSKIYNYTNMDVQKIGFSFSMMFDFIVIAFGLIMKEVYKLNNRKFNILFNTYILGTISLLLFNNYLVIGIRLSNYFKLSLILLLPYLISKIKSKKIRFFVVAGFVFIFFVLNMRFIQANYIYYFPCRIDLFGKIITL